MPEFVPAIDFDIQAARDAGANDAQIAEFLAEQNNFDLVGAREAGAEDTQISNFLTTGEQPTTVGIGGALLEGGKAGLAEIAGIGGTLREAAGETAIGQAFGLGREGIAEDILRIIQPTGEEITERAGIPSPEALPATERMLFKGGRVVGGSAPFAFTPLALAKTGIQARGTFGAILNAARTSPSSFILAETGGIFGAGAGAVLAEATDPGDVGTALIAEIAGGFINPIGLIGRVAGGNKNNFLQLIGSFTKAGKEARASQILQGLFEETGEDAAEVARMLNLASVRAGDITAAQKSGSPTLIAMERRLAARDAKFKGFSLEGERNAVSSLREAADRLAATGDPAALRVAAKLQQQYYEEVLDQQIEVARRVALEARGSLGKGTQAEAAARSLKVGKALDEALKTARRAEGELWDKIPKKIAIPLSRRVDDEGGAVGLMSRTDDAIGRLLPEELPGLGPVVKAAQRITKGDTTSGELLKLRRRALKGARDARANGDFTNASVLDEIAQGALDDLAELSGEGVDAARTYSAALNDKFTRSFGGSALERGRTGARRIPPELLLEQALGGGGAKGSLRFRELREAGAFADDSLLGIIRNEQEEFIRLAARETVVDGRVNPEKMRAFLAKNESVLDEFPALRQQLSDATSAERAFAEVEATVSTSRAAANERAFSIVLEHESPRKAVSAILRSSNPSRRYKELAKVAKDGNATDGLMSATLDHAIQKATSEIGEFSLTRFRRVLNEPLGRGQPTILGMMRNEGVLAGAKAKRLSKILDEAESLETALRTGQQVDELLDNPSGLFDLVVRIAGAKVGAAGAAGTTGSTIVAAGAGSRFFRNIFEKVPNTRIQDVLIEAAENPAFMSALLTKPKTVKQAKQLQRQINGFLVGAGIIAVGE